MIEIGPDDPTKNDVRHLLAAHIEDAFAHSPVDAVHALQPDRLLDADISFFSAREDGVLCGVGALREIGSDLGEIKSMHVAEQHRGRRIGASLLEHLLGIARERGYREIRLETGSMDAYAPARSLYRRYGFEPCPAFGDYTESQESVCMRLDLDLPFT